MVRLNNVLSAEIPTVVTFTYLTIESLNVEAQQAIRKNLITA
jgi:hypothetical protein